MIQKIKQNVTHQNIGGKEFIVDKEITKNLTNEELVNQFNAGNIACFNFVKRRPDFNILFPLKLYYVKVNGLGYIIASDEIDYIPEDSDIKFDDPNPNGSISGGAMASPTSPSLTQINNINDLGKIFKKLLKR